MTDLTTNTRDTLLDLYHAASGKIGVYLEAAVHHLTLSALSRRKYINVRLETDNGKRTRHAALTRNGALLVKELIPNIAAGISSNTGKQRFKPMDTRKRQPVTVHFDTANAAHVATLERIGQLKKERSFMPDLIRLLDMDKQLQAGDMFLLAVQYPAIVEQIRHEAVTDMVADATALQAQNKALIQMIGNLEAQVSRLESELDKRQVAPHVDFQQMLSAIAAINGKLDTMGQPATVDNKPIGLKALTPVAAGNGQPKQLAVPQFAAAPIEDDDEDMQDLLEIKHDSTAAERATKNFLSSIMGLMDDTNKPPRDNSKLPPRQRARLERDKQND